MQKHRILFSITDFLKKHNIFKKSPAISKLIDDVNKILELWVFTIIYFFIATAFSKLFIMMLSEDPDFQSIILYGERIAILIATMAVLTFTYAVALEQEKSIIIKSGKYFLKSFLNFIIGMIFLIGFRDVLINPSNVLHVPDFVFDLSIILTFIFMLSGFVMHILSAFFLASGITGLLKSLQK